mgnify:CR=1 FL=1|tara:strand:- start:38580 stop:39389 length:810 start_codon:yes stop_codon:yes gene_type:complete
MGLSQTEIRHFMNHGYVTKSDFFSARETIALQIEVDRLMREGALRNVATEGDGKTMSTTLSNMQLCPMYCHSDLFRALPFHSEVVKAISHLIGDPYILHLDQVFLKPGGTGMGTHWHQDNAYFRISDPLKGTGVWIAVHDATIDNGTMQVIPNSFKTTYEHMRDPYSDHHIRCYPPEDNIDTIELKAGSALFFSYGTAHCTGPNKTDKPRAGIAFHFLQTDFAPKKLIEPNRNYRPYITGTNASGGMSEYGVRVEGTWDSEVEKVLRYA